jgi:hypothetical protein
MEYDFEDCFDEIEDIEDVEIDYTVVRDIQQKKQKIKRQNKKIKNKLETE